MAKITFNPLLEGAQGKMGNVVFRRAWTGQMTLIKRADMSKVSWSDEQKAHRQRFKEAVAYAKAAVADPQLKLTYQQAAAQQGKRPFDLAVSEYFKQVSR